MSLSGLSPIEAKPVGHSDGVHRTIGLPIAPAWGLIRDPAAPLDGPSGRLD